MSITVIYGGVFKGLIFDTIVRTRVVFGHVCTYGLNKVNFHLDFGVIQGKFILVSKNS